MIDCAIRTSGSSVRPAGSNRRLVNFSTNVSSGTPYCRPMRDRDREGVHHAGQGRALLAELEEDLAEAVVGVGAGGQVALGATDGERGRLARPRFGRRLRIGRYSTTF